MKKEYARDAEHEKWKINIMNLNVMKSERRAKFRADVQQLGAKISITENEDTAMIFNLDNPNMVLHC